MSVRILGFSVAGILTDKIVNIVGGERKKIIMRIRKHVGDRTWP